MIRSVAPAAAVLALAFSISAAAAADAAVDQALSRLVAAYPDALERIDGQDLVWRDGTRMKIDDGRGPKHTEAELENASILDMVRDAYPAGAPPAAPPQTDPGRARNTAFFTKLYGDCAKGSVEPNLTEIVWLPSHGARRLKVTAREGVAARLKAVSARLEQLPATVLPYLIPPAGAYTCRTIAGTGRRSAHGYGIAVDIALKHAHYWRWSAAGTDGKLAYRNEIPAEIVAAFESEGFIWGGRWRHYDTMHFEYRPELFPAPPPAPHQ